MSFILSCLRCVGAHPCFFFHSILTKRDDFFCFLLYRLFHYTLRGFFPTAFTMSDSFMAAFFLPMGK